MVLTPGPRRLRLALQPPALEELVLDLRERDELGVALDVAEDPVRVGADDLVEAALLPRALEAGGGDLLDVDVRDGVGGGGGGRGGALVLGDLEGDGGVGDGLAEEEGDALEGEAGLDAVGELLVLREGLVGGEGWVGWWVGGQVKA